MKLLESFFGEILLAFDFFHKSSTRCHTEGAKIKYTDQKSMGK